ncbi:MAG: precorrin-4 C(11)-methyltransferase [Rhodospirillaceae bacterium]|jgi:precorrin-4/cobalt-precorrin-4 C11-methyltransferase|nr:precorrin-4 C(11)-methyltransferase [Rhodospirillaceae bacterium]MDP6645604.1 precorrin-4 C(11)-methyltransferase [Rhodospirillales bacterium]|tara:strand:+ start:34 stop:789 length:756 start_codon:yes stop_codon:yes gene_type:complete
MTVHFIGAGPGAPDLITVRGLNLIKACPVCLYAGSLVPAEVVAGAPEGAVVIDTAPLHLDQIIELIREAHEKGQDVARVHSGDPSIYGAVSEQMRRLNDLGIDYDITPGVPAFAAAAAAMNSELTLPGVTQTVIITRTRGKSSPMPEGEDLPSLAKAGATMALHLSVRNLAKVVRELSPEYGADCPVVVVYRASWPDQKIVHGTLKDIREKVRAEKITRTALILIGEAFGEPDFADSKLYDADHKHILRPK